ncbi:MAG: SDR family oxidoreductase [Rhizobacter sp.]
MRASLLSPRHGPWAVVTGASQGIGRAFALRLAAQGINLVLVARRQMLLQALATEIESTHAVQCRVVVADLSDLKQVHAMIDATQGLDVGLLVAAAGFGTSGALIDSKLATEIEMVNVNCTALLILTQHFARQLSARGGGGIVLMSSLLAFHGVPRAANYAATKAYVQTLAEGLRVELAPHGVDVVASAPGPIRTGFAQRANLQMALALHPDVVAKATLCALGRQTTVRPGWLSKLLGWSLALLPRWGQVSVITQVMKGMTAHQKSESAKAQKRKER